MSGATTFAFRAMDMAGAASAGEMEAESKATVTEQLRQRGLIVLDVSEKSDPLKIEDIFKKWQGVDMRELAIFSRQFATLIASGMPMLRTLYTLEAQTQDEQIKEAVAGIRADVEESYIDRIRSGGTRPTWASCAPAAFPTIKGSSARTMSAAPSSSRSSRSATSASS